MLNSQSDCPASEFGKLQSCLASHVSQSGKNAEVLRGNLISAFLHESRSQMLNQTPKDGEVRQVAERANLQTCQP
jgi:hypothetical protein